MPEQKGADFEMKDIPVQQDGTFGPYKNQHAKFGNCIFTGFVDFKTGKFALEQKFDGDKGSIFYEGKFVNNCGSGNWNMPITKANKFFLKRSMALGELIDGKDSLHGRFEIHAFFADEAQPWEAQTLDPKFFGANRGARRTSSKNVFDRGSKGNTV